MDMPFMLGFAQPRQTEPAVRYSYDPRQQVNFLADGSRAIDSVTFMMGTSSTTSTAGSKTHNDDD